jgi:hypothetical protein
MALPKEVPALTAGDMHKGSLRSANGKKLCLVGWGDLTFADGHDWCAARKAIQDAAGVPHVAFISRFNDRPDIPKAKLAAVWNKAMRLLGYVRRGKKFVLPKAVKR